MAFDKIKKPKRCRGCGCIFRISDTQNTRIVAGKRADTDVKRRIGQQKTRKYGNTETCFHHFQSGKILVQPVADLRGNVVHGENISHLVIQTIRGKNKVLIIDIGKRYFGLKCKRVTGGGDQHQLIRSHRNKGSFRDRIARDEDTVQFAAVETFFQSAETIDRKFKVDIRIDGREFLQNIRESVIGDALDRTDPDISGIQSVQSRRKPVDLLLFPADDPK